MVAPWDPAEATLPVLSRAEGVVTLVDGQTFAVSQRNGDMAPDRAHGLFVLDTRMLSRFELRVDGHPVEALAVALDAPFEATIAARAGAVPSRHEPDLVILRQRRIGNGLAEQLTVTSHRPRSRDLLVTVTCDADFADLFEVKEGRPTPRRQDCRAHGTTVSFRADDGVTESVVHAYGDWISVEPGVIRWQPPLDPHVPTTLCVEIEIRTNGAAVTPRVRCNHDDTDAHLARQSFQEWHARTPTITTDHDVLAATVARTWSDLGALRIVDADQPEHHVIAAGAPWFMAVFGRDSLITAWMALMADRGLASGVLHLLARLQGTDVHPPTEEEPGRILHEVRAGPAARRMLGGRSTYYGSIDATPLFVMLLGEAWRWGLSDDDLEQLIPHADAAIRWITEFGDRDGDGYVEYQRATDHGLENQGWKDSWDGVPFADGRLADPPIALCEVQGYAYGAYLARAAIADARHEADLAARLRERARRLKEAFNRDFWLDEAHCFALALDGHKRPVDAITSNIGHCLWTGIVDDDKAAALRDHLVSPQLFSGWGIRTLATSMRSYNPISYHNGSVWPHDTAIGIAGLTRYGYVEEAQRIARGLLAAAGRHGSRLPELFAGLADHQITVPAAYPTSCEPQAWASAAPLLVVRSLLRFDPDVPGRTLAIAPALPHWIDHITIDGLDVGGHQLKIAATANTCEISGASDLRVL